MFHETESSPANLSGVVNWSRGEIQHSREAEQGTVAVVSRGPTAPSTAGHPRSLKKLRGCREPSFSSLFASQITAYAKNIYCCFPVAAARVGHRDSASHPRHPKSDSLLDGAGRNNLPRAAAPGGGAGRRSPRWLPTGVC